MGSHKWADWSAGAAGKCCICCRSCDLAVCGRRTQSAFKNKPKLWSLGRAWWRPLTGACDHAATQRVAGSDSVQYVPTKSSVPLRMHMYEGEWEPRTVARVFATRDDATLPSSFHRHYTLSYGNKIVIKCESKCKNSSLTRNAWRHAASSDATAKKCRRKSFYSSRAAGYSQCAPFPLCQFLPWWKWL